VNADNRLHRAGLGSAVEHQIQHLREELANSLTHGFGLLLSIAGLVVLVVFASLEGDAMRILTFSIFGATMVVLYAASTVYHSVRHPSFKQFMRFVDHAAIYLLIAGTYTPFLLLNMRDSVGWAMFAIVWIIAVFGIGMKSFRISDNPWLSSASYIAMGWICVLILKPAMEAIHPSGLWMILAGGIAYTGGVIFYALERLPYNHAIWHGFVMTGTALHFFAVFFYAAYVPQS
jgi:hemolysin III